MVSLFGRTWGGMVLRGILSILFGIAIFAMPNIALQSLVLVFGAFAFADGVVALINAFRMKAGHDRWWALLLEGLVGIAVGILTLVQPGITALALLYMIAAWAIVTGLLEIVAGIRYRAEMEHEWMLILAGILSVIFGVLLIVNPGAGIQAVLWIIGAYAIAFGVLMAAAGLRARARTDTRTTAPTATA
jgi:uncharacterized membrane protein HdeD (DUF308 family)